MIANGFSPHITDHYDEQQRTDTHGSIDFNYDVPGQSSINLQHSMVYESVDVRVIFVGENYNPVKIDTPDDGSSH
ncbi:unnamed protein product [Rotaria sp. Silwood1]|nr:unnamed protein product [Rotaria sp. Silwood1]CAF4660826.1 unnamed protein product [Rotaria sp. Silwood1]CAF4820780.1 unnamed protein product [Rotaria sp. Silwood1]